MITAISYANGPFKKSQKYNRISAKLLGGIDKVICYGPELIDEEFKRENAVTLSNKRGNGLWLWKPYFINQALGELAENDYLIYADSTIVFQRNVKGLISLLEESGQSIMLFDLPLVEIQWSKQLLFDKLEANEHRYQFSNQRSGSVMIFKKDAQTVKFVMEWLELCKQEELLDYMPAKDTKNEFFLNHREDQSIISLLSKKYNIQSFSDPTDYGKFPTQYIFYDVLFSQKSYEQGYRINKTYFIHHRGYNVFLYYLKFIYKGLFVNLIYRPRIIKK